MDKVFLYRKEDKYVKRMVGADERSSAVVFLPGEWETVRVKASPEKGGNIVCSYDPFTEIELTPTQLDKLVELHGQNICYPKSSLEEILGIELNNG
jgi:hypothetical protein